LVDEIDRYSCLCYPYSLRVQIIKAFYKKELVIPLQVCKRTTKVKRALLCLQIYDSPLLNPLNHSLILLTISPLLLINIAFILKVTIYLSNSLGWYCWRFIIVIMICR